MKDTLDLTHTLPAHDALMPQARQQITHGKPARIAATARAAKPLLDRSITEHRTLMEHPGVA